MSPVQGQRKDMEYASGRTERILYIDDSHFDRDLVRDAVSADPGLVLTETSNRQEFEGKLAAEPFDLVLSDFNILGFDGLMVIAAVEESQPHVPVVIVTGTGSEEIAVDAMKRGAADYVIKSPRHIVRLPLTIRTVLEKTRLQRDQERLRAELDLFFGLSHDMLLVLNGDGRIQRTNPAFNKTWEFMPDRLREMTIYDLMSQDDRLHAENQIGQIRETLPSAQFSVRCRRPDASELWVEWNVFRSNRPDRLFAIGRDITQRRAAEAEERERAVAKAKISMLSPREQQVLRLVVAGSTNKRIAFELDLSEKTVERHRSSGMRKLKVHSVPDLVRIALLAKL